MTSRWRTLGNVRRTTRSARTSSGALRIGTWLVAALLTMVGTATAQTVTVNGTIDATIDGEARRWTTLYVTDVEDGPQSTAAFHRTFMNLVDMTVQGHVTEGSFQVAGALAVTAMLMNGVPTGCPCPVPDPEILWFSGTSMFEDVYQSVEAEVVLDVVEPVGENAWRVHGTFRGVLAYLESVYVEPDESQTVTIEGTFAVDPMILDSDEE
ncbi:MAG: hypothetical protein R6W77_05220 [Trueperaceae bacterium]